MNKKIKNNKGFTTIDAAIAVVVLTIFIPVVTTLIYNIAITSKSVERKAKAVNYAIQYLEYAKMQDASTINLTTLKLKQDLENGYTAGITITNNTDSTKKVTVQIKYNVGKDEKQISLYTNI